MKNEIYWVICLSFFIIVFGFCFQYYVETKLFIAPLVAHKETTTGYILRQGLNWVNEKGEDSSCHITFEKSGRMVVEERWNIGNCDIGRPISVEYLSYQF